MNRTLGSVMSSDLIVDGRNISVSGKAYADSDLTEKMRAHCILNEIGRLKLSSELLEDSLKIMRLLRKNARDKAFSAVYIAARLKGTRIDERLVGQTRAQRRGRIMRACIEANRAGLTLPRVKAKIELLSLIDSMSLDRRYYGEIEHVAELARAEFSGWSDKTLYAVIAYHLLKEMGKEITQKMVAEKFGMMEQTVKLRYRDFRQSGERR